MHGVHRAVVAGGRQADVLPNVPLIDSLSSQQAEKESRAVISHIRHYRHDTQVLIDFAYLTKRL
jgi:hypothetical protein